MELKQHNWLEKPYLPQEISQVDYAFPANVKHLMPDPKDIPREFYNHSKNKFISFFEDLFYKGITEFEATPKEGINSDKAVRHVMAISRSFGPRHEDKTAAVAFLLSEWFSDITWKPEEKRQL